MYVIPELRLNRFEDVRIPNSKDLYIKLGLRSVVRPGSVGQDGEFTEPVNTMSVMSKQDSLTLGQHELYRQYAESLKSVPTADDNLSFDSSE